MIHSKKDDVSCDLIGSWTVHVGDMDQCVHLWRYTGGFEKIDRAYELFRNNEVSNRFGVFVLLCINLNLMKKLKFIHYFLIQDYVKLQNERGQLLRSRHLQYMLAFSYWPQITARDPTHIYEMRSYRLKPGTMIEWANNWARAINFRQTNNEAYAGFFSQIGRLYNVHHVWCKLKGTDEKLAHVFSSRICVLILFISIVGYKSLQDRKESREAAWRSPGWDECVAYTVPLIREMHCRILRPTNFSPTQ